MMRTLVAVLLACALGGLGAVSWAAGAADQPKRGGTLIYGLSTEPPDLDPHVNSGSSAGNVKAAVYQGLVRYGHGGVIEPALAEHWGLVGQTQYVFHLRPGVKFHNGDPLTAADVKFSMDRILDPKTGSALRSSLKAIKSVEVVDPMTVKIVLSEPFAPLLAYLAEPYGAIVDAKFVQGGANLRSVMMGTGPFKFVSWDPGQRIRLVRNDAYWESGKPYLDGINFVPLADAQTRLTALRAGDIMMMDFVPQEQMNAIARDTQLKLYADVGIFMCIIFNPQRKPYDDVRVRQAISYAIDRNAVVKTIFDGRGTPITGDVIPNNWWSHDAKADGMYTYQPDKARQLLKEAGYGDGLKITILAPITYSLHTRTAQVLQAQLAKVGIQAQLDLPEWAVVLNRHNQGDFAIEVRGLSASVNDPDFLSLFYESDSTFYPKQVGFKDAQLDQWLDQARALGNQAIRKQLYAKIEERALMLAPWVYIAWGDQGEAARAYVRGYDHYPGPLGTYSGYSLSETWLAK
ncbi:MAG TPA: ABC transporter substrate-binding protein [bacterium]|nr:ABC transporter substrate-binding protein [bacterium]